MQLDSDLLHNLKDSPLSPSCITLPSLKSQQSPQTNRQTNQTVITTSSLAEVKINVLRRGWKIGVVLQVEREEEKRMLLSELNWEIKAWGDVRESGGSGCTDVCTNVVPWNYYGTLKSRCCSHWLVELSVSFTLDGDWTLSRLTLGLAKDTALLRWHDIFQIFQNVWFVSFFHLAKPLQMWFHFPRPLQAPCDSTAVCFASPTAVRFKHRSEGYRF